MTRLTFPVPPTADKGTFAAGWNEYCQARAFRATETKDWKLGWEAAHAVTDGERRPFNDTAPVANVKSMARAA